MLTVNSRKRQGSNSLFLGRREPLDPIVTLLPPNRNAVTTVTALCFLNENQSHTSRVANNNKYSASAALLDDEKKIHDDSEYDSDFSINLQCNSILQQQKTSLSPPTDMFQDLHGRHLVTCYYNGECHIWDLYRRSIVESISSSKDVRGPGLTVRNLTSNDQSTSSVDTRFFFQTRDESGTISLHDWGCSTKLKTVQTINCYSQSFCCAAPCQGNMNLIAIPCQEHSYVMVRDWRVPSSHHPVAYFHGGSGEDEDNSFAYPGPTAHTKYGMVTSLAMVEDDSVTLIACGMENGSVVYHDLSMLHKKSKYSYEPCEISLGADPILSLDMVSSKLAVSDLEIDQQTHSYVSVVGMAGNEEDLIDLPQCDRGRIAVLKTSLCPNLKGDAMLQVRMRCRISASDKSSLPTTTTEILNRKPGVGICRFRPDGRIFAVGGWDKRVRIYDRRSNNRPDVPIALLRGHDESVNTLDWSPDAAISGLIATGSSDGQVHVWCCFPGKGK